MASDLLAAAGKGETHRYPAADELILFKEYFTSYQLDESSYKAGFTGLTGDSFTGDEALISGATVSSDAIRVATEDAFTAFAAVNENGGEIG